jgi:hypothetical protein
MTAGRRIAFFASLILAAAACNSTLPETSAAGQPTDFASDVASAVGSVDPSLAPTHIPAPPDFTVSWTEMPWSGRITGASFDLQLGIWMAFGSKEMWTSPDGATWERRTFQGEDLGEGCPDPQPPRMIDAVRMGDRLWAAGTWDNDCDVLALLVWSSSDGAAWEIVPQGLRGGFSAHSIATNGSTLAIANTDYGEGRGDVITSDGGAGWTSHVVGSPAAMLDVFGDADGFVAVGYRLQAGLYAPAIWTSEDGSVWIDASPESAYGRLRSVVRADDGTYVAAGLDADGAIQVWHARTGQAWSVRRLPSPPVTSGAVWPEVRLAASGNRIVLLADTTKGWWFWSSNDGQGWSDGQPMDAAGGSYFGPHVAMSRDRVISFLDEALPGDDSSHVVVGKITPAE